MKTASTRRIPKVLNRLCDGIPRAKKRQRRRMCKADENTVYGKIVYANRFNSGAGRVRIFIVAVLIAEVLDAT